MKDKEAVEEFRKLLGRYDAGDCTASEVFELWLVKVLEPAMGEVAKGRETGWGRSYCGSDPDREPQRAILEFNAPGKPLWLKPMPK